MFIEYMPFWLVDWLGTIQTIAVFLTITFLGVSFWTVTGLKQNPRRVVLARICNWILVPSVLVLLACVLQSGLLDRRFRTLFSELRPRKFADKIAMSGKVLTNLTERRDVYEQSVTAYLAQKQAAERMPSTTVAEIQERIDALRALPNAYEVVLVKQESIKERRVVAYWAGFEEEARSIRILSFDEPNPELPHRKFTQ